MDIIKNKGNCGAIGGENWLKNVKGVQIEKLK
jgi:hypothetical protein